MIAAIPLTATDLAGTTTVDLIRPAVEQRGFGPNPTEVYATADGRYALVRWVSDGSCLPRLVRLYPRVEAAVAANKALHGGNPVAEAKAKRKRK